MPTQALHRVATNTGILYARMAITVFISLYATRLTLTALGIEDFGLYNLVGGVIAMLGFLNASMASATQRFMSFAQGEGDLDKVKRIFNMSAQLHLGIAVAVVIVFEVAGYFFFNGLLNIELARLPIAKLVYQFMVASTLFTIISVPYEAVITSHENMLFFAITGVIESVLKLAIALYITYGTLALPTHLSYTSEHLDITFSTFDNLVIYSLLMALLTVFMLLLKRLYCHKKYPECELNFKKHYDKPLLKQISSFAGWSFMSSAGIMIGNYGQGLVMNIFFGTTVNAAQGIANQVSGQLGSLAGAMQKALSPLITKSEGGGNRALMLKASIIGSKLSFFLLMIFFIPVLIEMPYIFKLWLKTVPEYAVIFCRLLLIRNLIEQLYCTLAITISAQGNIRGFEISSSLLNILPLVISYYLFTQHFDVYVIYIAYIIYSIILALITIYFAKINCGLSIISFFKNVILRCIFTFIVVYVMAIIPLYFLDTGYLRLSVIITMAITGSLIVIWFIGFNFDEREKIKSIINQMLGKFHIKIPL